MATPAKGKKKPVVDEDNINVQIRAKLESAGLADTLKYADEYIDMDVECVSTGFPGLDLALHPKLKGLPKGRDIEISSREGNVGKTSIALQIAKYWQSQGLSVGIADIEKTITKPFLTQLGIEIDPKSEKPAVLIMRSEIDDSTEEGVALAAEDILNTISKANKILDLIIVDSVDAMVGVGDMEKGAQDKDQMGGISKMLKGYFRKNVNKKSTILWINQQRKEFDAYSDKWVTTGGGGPSFYSTIRLSLTRIESLKIDKDADPYGFITLVKIFKNKVSPQDRAVKLPYIHDEGFSRFFDYFNFALKMKVIEKNGGWYQFPAGDSKKNPKLKEDPNFTRVQGMLNFYNEMKEKPKLFAVIQHLVDGEDVSDEVEVVPTTDIAAPAEE
jgi:recombination protein RecA